MEWAASRRQMLGGKGDDLAYLPGALGAAQLNKTFTRELHLAFKYGFGAW